MLSGILFEAEHTRPAATPSRCDRTGHLPAHPPIATPASARPTPSAITLRGKSTAEEQSQDRTTVNDPTGGSCQSGWFAPGISTVCVSSPAAQHRVRTDTVATVDEGQVPIELAIGRSRLAAADVAGEPDQQAGRHRQRPPGQPAFHADGTCCGKRPDMRNDRSRPRLEITDDGPWRVQ
jgi:hypothetical protein